MAFSVKNDVISRETLGGMERLEMREWALKRKVSTKPQMRGMSKEELLNHIVNRPKFVNFEIDEEFEDLIPRRIPLRLTKADDRAIARQSRPPLPPRRKKVKRVRKPPQPRGTVAEREVRFDKLFGTGIGKTKLDALKRNRRLP